MQLHQISSQKNQKNKKRVGRGGKHGTFSGRGVKGQKSRAGRKLRPEWRDVLKRIPKRRGYRFKSLQVKPQVVNLEQLNHAFKENELVSARTLLNKGLIIKIKDRAPKIKILGSGELNKKLDFKGLAMSQGAKQKITKAGGLIS
jgi:large subunit ribosomal protein L15